MVNKLNGKIVIAFILQLTFCLCEDSQETSSIQEYLQIFRGIPNFFEYLLDVVERRPEILENDKITAFEDNREAPTNNKKKREISFGNDREFKRDTSSVESVTEITEYGNVLVSTDSKANVKREIRDLYNINKDYIQTQKLSKTMYSKIQYNGVLVPKNAKGKTDNNELQTKDIRTDRFQRISNAMDNNNTMVKSYKNNKDYNNNKFGDSILGDVDWNTLSLAPEEVEEYALKVEKAIEENVKKQKDK